jgi:beta-propeller uncharacterized protein DUF5122
VGIAQTRACGRSGGPLNKLSCISGACLLVVLALSAQACHNGEDSGASGGSPATEPPSFNNTVFIMSSAFDGSGDVYVGGDFTTYDGAQAIRIVRLNPDSTIDSGFKTGVGFNGRVLSLVPAGSAGGAIYVGGDFTTYNGVERSRIVRLSADGSLDASLAIGTGFDNAVHIITPADGTGALYVGGDFTEFNGIKVNRLVRLKADGTVDPAFAIGTGFDGTVFAVIPATDGSGDVYVGGAFTVYNGATASKLVRLNADGSRDAGFVTGTGFDNIVQTIAPADGGDLYVGGAFNNYDGKAANGLVRLTANGVINPFLATGAGFDNTVFHVMAAGDASGDLYVAGAFTRYNGVQANQLVRLNQNGTLDTSFSTGPGFSDTVFRVLPAGDASGDVYAGGQFVRYQSTPIGRFVRLTSTGAFLR